MSITVILKYDKREETIQVDKTFFLDLLIIHKKIRQIFDISPISLIDIKFIDGEEKKLLTKDNLHSLLKNCINNSNTCLYITQQAVRSQTMLFPATCSQPTQVERSISVSSRSSSSNSNRSFSDFNLNPKFIECKLEIQIRSSENIQKFSEKLNFDSNFKDLLKLIRECVELPDAQFEICYFESDDRKESELALNNDRSFGKMIELYKTFDKSKRIISAKEKSVSGSFSLRFLSSVSTSSLKSNSGSFSEQDKGQEMVVILEEFVENSQSSVHESNIHNIKVREFDTSSDLFKNVKSKIDGTFELKYFHDEKWFKLTDDDSVKIMIGFFLNSEPKLRKIKAIISNSTKSVNFSFKTRSVNGSSVPKRDDTEFLEAVKKTLEKKYEDVNELARGGFSIVYKVSDNGKTKIVKVILDASSSSDVSYLNQALQESNRSLSLKHPNVANIESSFIETDPTFLYLVMEYFPLGDMFKIIDDNHQMPEQEVWSLIKQGALALQFLKEKNIIHRDIKPENILQKAGQDGKVYLLSDFGLSKQVESSRTLTRNNVAGTFEYLAPELSQKIDKKELVPYSFASDMFAFGATVFRLLSFTGRGIDIGSLGVISETKLFENIESLIKKRCGNYSKRLIELITKMVLYNPNDRIKPDEVLKICENTRKCLKCSKFKDSTCYAKCYTNCSCNNSICTECISFYMEDCISTMVPTTTIKCMKCSQSLTDSDIQIVTQPNTYQTYLTKKRPPQPTIQPTSTPSTNQQNQNRSTQQQVNNSPLSSRPTSSTTNSRPKKIHDGVTCDGCFETSIEGIRWKCLACSNYDLCTACYQKRNSTTHKNHKFAKLEILDPTFVNDLSGGEINLQVKDYEEAIEYFDRALKKYPLCEQALMLKATCEMELEQYRNAKVICDKVLNECNAHSVDACIMLSKIYSQHGNPTSAISYLERAIKIDPNNELSQYLLARTLQTMNNYSKALVHARTAFRLNNDNANTTILAELLVQNHQWQEGRLVLVSLLLKNPNNAEALYCLGLCEENLGDLVESYKSFKSAASKNPFEPKYALAAERTGKLVLLLGALLQ